ncbi:hypothetical protein FRX31_030114 [Thalictrum thalictroides]|uniref:PB1-like domain-containing protein n=1 Tax=Thalictrum thalictroides TaxID=46969 RepID=A0A7J6V5E7_THATH|nr:hypothetical protein FRX31_030114 [Thalictrum thalictroides]
MYIYKDKCSYFEIIGILKVEFGYSNVNKVHYCVPPKSLEVGLRLLVDDAPAGKMLYEAVAVGSQVQIYVEHEHEEEKDEFNDEIRHEVSEKEVEVSEGYLIDELDMLEEDEQVAEEIDMHVFSDTQVHSELEVHMCLVTHKSMTIKKLVMNLMKTLY